VFFCLRLARQVEAEGSQPVHSFLCYQTCEHIFWKRMTRFRCQLVQVVHMQGHERIKFVDQEVKGQGHTRRRMDFKAWCENHSRSLESSRFSFFNHDSLSIYGACCVNVRWIVTVSLVAAVNGIASISTALDATNRGLMISQHDVLCASAKCSHLMNSD